jgi:hypothetical protein
MNHVSQVTEASGNQNSRIALSPFFYPANENVGQSNFNSQPRAKYGCRELKEFARD